MKISKITHIAKTIANLYLSQIGIRRFPFSMVWHITWRCNSHCLHCEFGKNDSEQLRMEEVPLERVKEVISEAAMHGAGQIAFAGGEPFLRKDFIEIIRHCKKEGLIVIISTNGFILSNPRAAREAADSGVDRIDISLDSPDELHDELRNVKGAFNMVDKAIDNLKAARQGKQLYIGINSVVSGFNLDKVIPLFEYAKAKGIDGVGLQPFHHTQARAKELIPRFLLNQDQINELKKTISHVINSYGDLLANSSFFAKHIATYYENDKMPGFKCYGGLQEIHLLGDGKVGVCCFFSGKLSVKEYSLKEILSSDDFKQLLKKAETKNCPGCWSPPVHEYNIIFRPSEILSGIRLVKRFLKWN